MTDNYENTSNETIYDSSQKETYYPHMQGQKRRLLPHEASGKHYKKEGLKSFFSCIFLAFGILLINIALLIIFKWNFWALYFANIGFIIIRPLFNHFNQKIVIVTNLRSGQSWEETQGLKGIIIALVIINIITYLWISIAKVIFPPYAFMEDFILIAASAFVSGRYIIQFIRQAFLNLKIHKAGKALMKDPTAPRVKDVIKQLEDTYSKHSFIYLAVAIGLCILAILAQYCQVWVLTPGIENSLDKVALYQSQENALPFSKDAIHNSKGEFSKFSTEYTTDFHENLEYMGVAGEYNQNVVYKYNHKNKCWKIKPSSPTISITSVNISGTWSAGGCIDNLYQTDNMTFVLNISSFNSETVNGTFIIKNATDTIYTGNFSGSVAQSGKYLNATAKLEIGRKQFFDEGYTELTFYYDIQDGTIALFGDYTGVLNRQ